MVRWEPTRKPADVVGRGLDKRISFVLGLDVKQEDGETEETCYTMQALVESFFFSLSLFVFFLFLFFCLRDVYQTGGHCGHMVTCCGRASIPARIQEAVLSIVARHTCPVRGWHCADSSASPACGVTSATCSSCTDLCGALSCERQCGCPRRCNVL